MACWTRAIAKWNVLANPELLQCFFPDQVTDGIESRLERQNKQKEAYGDLFTSSMPLLPSSFVVAPGRQEAWGLRNKPLSRQPPPNLFTAMVSCDCNRLQPAEPHWNRAAHSPDPSTTFTFATICLSTRIPAEPRATGSLGREAHL